MGCNVIAVGGEHRRLAVAIDQLGSRPSWDEAR
jgi:hypothetical protein